MKRFILPYHRVQEDSATLSTDDYHYLARVLRLIAGSHLELVIAHREVWKIEIRSLKPQLLLFKVLSINELPTSLMGDLIIAQVLPKQDKMSTVLRMCTELGAAQFVPVVSQHCDKNWKAHTDKKQLRWEAILKSSAEQSRQHHIPTLHPVIPLETLPSFAQTHCSNAIRFVAYELANRPLMSACESISVDLPILILVGPEGGFDATEITFLEEMGFLTISLGTTILRTEHAAFFACAQVLGARDIK